MGLIRNISTWLGLRAPVVRSTGAMPAALMPPSRVIWDMNAQRALAVPAVFRAIQVLTTAASQLSLDVRRGSIPVDRVPSIIRRPSIRLRLDEWLAGIVLDMATDGNAYLAPQLVDGTVVDLPILPAREVHVQQHPRTGRITYHHAGRTYADHEIIQLDIMRAPGALKGLSPLEAARRGLTFSASATEYAAEWFTGSGQPAGILSSEQTLSKDQADQARDVWNGLDADGNPVTQNANPSGIKVLGKGLSYEPILLKPSDVLWLEAQNFNLIDIARLYGTPLSLMHLGIEGSSLTYANVTQEWLGFTRFTLMAYLRPIELALTDLVPRGSEVRFNLEALLRADTTTRYAAHASAIEAGWLTVDEVRSIEGYAPLNTVTDQETTNA